MPITEVTYRMLYSDDVSALACNKYKIINNISVFSSVFCHKFASFWLITSVKLLREQETTPLTPGLVGYRLGYLPH